MEKNNTEERPYQVLRHLGWYRSQGAGRPQVGFTEEAARAEQDPGITQRPHWPLFALRPRRHGPFRRTPPTFRRTLKVLPDTDTQTQAELGRSPGGPAAS